MKFPKSFNLKVLVSTLLEYCTRSGIYSYFPPHRCIRVHKARAPSWLIHYTLEHARGSVGAERSVDCKSVNHRQEEAFTRKRINWKGTSSSSFFPSSLPLSLFLSPPIRPFYLLLLSPFAPLHLFSNFFLYSLFSFPLRLSSLPAFLFTGRYNEEQQLCPSFPKLYVNNDWFIIDNLIINRKFITETYI